MTLRFQLAPWNGFERLKADWRELEARGEPPFFLTWDWIGCWLAEARLEPSVLRGTDEGRTVLLGLLLPSRRSEMIAWSTHGLRLHTTGDEAQDVITIEYNGFLVDRGWAGRAEGEAVAFLLGGVTMGGNHRRDELHLRGASAEDEAFVPASARCQIVSRKPSYRIDLDTVRNSGRGYLAHLGNNTRQQIRRSIRLYEQRGPLEARAASDLAEARDYLYGLKELHQRYWTARNDAGGFGHPFFEAFVRRLMEECLPRGTIELVRISCGETAIGYVYNFIARGHVYYYLAGFRYEPDPKLKPGLVSHYLCVERHLGLGSAVYDFMAGEARYKANMGEPGPDMLYLIAQRPTLLLRFENALRDSRSRLR